MRRYVTIKLKKLKISPAQTERNLEILKSLMVDTYGCLVLALSLSRNVG